MTASLFIPMNGPPMSGSPMGGVYPVAIPRAQVGIERLPSRRMSNEPRESMNCKSCRKRKIKCNRLRPSCEACQVFQCPCVYDAVPKKRGPKTDVLEALLKRVDGLEAKLKEKNADSPTTPSTPDASLESPTSGATPAESEGDRQPKRPALDTNRATDGNEPALFSPAPPRPASPIQAEVFLDTYFTRFHAKPYYILDESSVRQRLQLNQVPDFLLHAIYAVSARFAIHPNGYRAAVKSSEEYAAMSRRELDIDEPSVDALQSLLLLVVAFTAAGKGKKAYMAMTNAVGMATALEIHREIDVHARITPVERDVRRRLFWTCYLLDRFLACGSKRPSLISDKAILLRLPSWSPSHSSLPIEGEFFNPESNLQYLLGSGKKYQGSTGLLIDITRILDVTNRYLAAGGVKGDSHFPWHSLSTLSKIRQDLDTWASGTDELFSDPTALFGQADSTVLVLSKLIYHVIYCLIYRPFLPIDLSELSGTGQHQSWQIESTNLCFLHANSIAELVELGNRAGSVEWPEFVGYCICTAGTVHIHGAQYHKSGAGPGTGVFASSADHLSREMQQLSELRYAWASVQHQRETLQEMCRAHAELVSSVAAGGGAGYPAAFQLEDFFDRYASMGEGQGCRFDAANLSLADVTVDFMADSYTGHDLYAPREGDGAVARAGVKRKNTAPSGRRPSLAGFMQGQGQAQASSPRGAAPHLAQRHSFSGMPPPPSPMITSPMGAQPDMGDAHMRMEHQMEVGHGMVPEGFMPAQASPVSPMSGAHFPYGFGGGHRMGAQGYEMFDAMSAGTFGAGSGWHGQHGEGAGAGAGVGVGVGMGQAAGREGSIAVGTSEASGEEKDPFLSLLEQLAENEGRRGDGQGMEFDFFLGGEGHGR